jgi:hypothetical protein
VKTIHLSYDIAEWTRYYIAVEVDETLPIDEQKEQVFEAIAACDIKERGSKCLGNVEFADVEYNWPDDMGERA